MGFLAAVHYLLRMPALESPVLQNSRGSRFLQVAEARKRKARRLKQAKDEAQSEIERYRHEKETNFKVSGTNPDTGWVDFFELLCRGKLRLIASAEKSMISSRDSPSRKPLASHSFSFSHSKVLRVEHSELW